ncbi:MAG: arabinose efflux permease [uncultured archaeon A07HN63]|nr:MAG: arabinose efflux permease [uncultured archaeon A07HN63]
MGTASGVYFVAANPLLSELFPDRVGRVMGIHGAANQVAAVAAAPLVAVSLWVDWRLSLLAIAVGTAVVTASTVVVARRTEMPAAGADDRSLLAGARSEWQIILSALAIAGITAFVWQGVFNFYELYMQARGLTPNEASTMLTIVFAAGIPAFFIAGELADRFPSVPFLLGIIFSFAGCLLLLIAVEGFLALAVVSAALGFVIHALFPATDAYILTALPDSARGSAYAVFSSAWILSQSTGSSVVGALIERGLTYGTVFTAGALVLFALVAVLGVLEQVGKLPA